LLLTWDAGAYPAPCRPNNDEHIENASSGQRTEVTALITMKKRNFFSDEFFTINKETFPYYQGKIFLPYP
jgi:hypothetical protein